MYKLFAIPLALSLSISAPQTAFAAEEYKCQAMFPKGQYTLTFRNGRVRIPGGSIVPTVNEDGGISIKGHGEAVVLNMDGTVKDRFGSTSAPHNCDLAKAKEHFKN